MAHATMSVSLGVEEYVYKLYVRGFSGVQGGEPQQDEAPTERASGKAVGAVPAPDRLCFRQPALLPRRWERFAWQNCLQVLLLLISAASQRRLVLGVAREHSRVHYICDVS
jgi:hypothetical protein